MAKKQFKAESKRLMDLMINSIYTNKEIFLRELISNASDAIDKYYYSSLSEGISGVSRSDFFISVSADKESRTIVIEDNGIGMSAEEMESNLGVIARSGSGQFKSEIAKDEENESADEIDIIGQFGVGFYSAFMIADNVKVISKSAGSEEAFCWESEGADGYSTEKAEKESRGTKVVLTVKENSDEENYDTYLESYILQNIVKKYSDYIRYPIKMEVEKSRLKEGSEDEYESYTETETINSMIPIWKRNKNELGEEDYNNFYRDKFHDFSPPTKVIHSSTEGASTYNALMFIPSSRPYDYYTKEFEKGLKLYASGVLIMDKCADLLPDHFSFVKGLVDSQDLSLNISREMLQQDRQLKTIATRLEKGIKRELLSMLRNEREEYDKFFDNFGLQLKFGLYCNFGMHKELLSDLVLFYSSKEKKKVNFEEYVERMPEDQKFIYYACGANVEQIDRMPQTEAVKEKDFEILYCTDDVDEFALQVLGNIDGKEFKSVSAGDLGFETDDNADEKTDEFKDMFDFMVKSLDGKVSSVKISSRLKTHPVCLSSEGQISLEMEKVLNAMPNDQKVKAERVLELNASHGIFDKIKQLYADDKDMLKDYTNLLYSQALLIEGIALDDAVAFSEVLSKIMMK